MLCIKHAYFCTKLFTLILLSKRRILLLVGVLYVVIFVSSCVSHRSLQYLNETLPSSNEAYEIIVPKIKLNKGSKILVEIRSPDPDMQKLLSVKAYESQSNSFQFIVDGLVLNDNGEITLPLVNTISLLDLTIEEAQIRVKEKLEIFLKEVTIYIKCINYQITVLGEVNKPGTYTFYDETPNIYQVLSLAGDLTHYANRSKVGKISINNSIIKRTTINLNNNDVFVNKQFYLTRGDVIIVPSRRYKAIEMSMVPWKTIVTATASLAVLLKIFNLY